MKNRNIWRALLLGLSCLLLFLTCWSIDGWTDEKESKQTGGQEEDLLRPEPRKIRIGDGDESCEIHSWYNVNDGRDYFFVPDYLRRTAEGLEEEENLIMLSDIPTVCIRTESGDLDWIRESKENRDDILFSLLSEDGEEASQLRGKIKARGNASFHSPKLKKSYTVELKEKTSLLQMAESRKWLLLAHYFDDTHLLDHMTFDMARQLGMAYVPEGKWVNLYVDGNFQGIYYLCERIEIGAQKVNVRDMEELQQKRSPDQAIREFPYMVEGEKGGQEMTLEKGFLVDDFFSDITGGYLLELEYHKERYDEEPSGFVSEGKQLVVVASPKYATQSQVSYIKNRYQEFEDALERSNENDTDEFLDYMDLDSFVQKYLIEEVSKNMDANFSSQYLYKDTDTVDGKFYAGPVWDYDRGYDNKVDDLNNRGADKFWANQAAVGTEFWKKLYENPIFQNRVKEIYREKLSPVLNEYADTRIWEWGDRIQASVAADMFLYQDQYEEKMDEQKRLSEEMETLAQFIRERKVFLDSEWRKDG